MRLMPDYFYPLAAETSINYGTLGTYMAEVLFNSSLPPYRVQTRVNCFVNYARQLGLDLSGGLEDVVDALRT
ncbi:hypothetical protein V5799_027536, partial [Amblyomma americanum]